MTEMSNYEQLAAHLAEARYPVFFTGAGASTESGLPDFRSRQGLWTKNPARIASVENLERDPEGFYQYYKERRSHRKEYHPNRVHTILAKWEQQGKVGMIITQNVDGLHQAAGSQNVAELHGTMSNIRCHQCGKVYDWELYDLRNCPECGGLLRPNVVLFGEALPQREYLKAHWGTEQADLFVVIGSSLVVYPAAGFVERAAQRGVKVAIINDEPTALDHLAEWLFHYEKAGDVMEKVDGHLQRMLL